jgi:hypothetical protein
MTPWDLDVRDAPFVRPAARIRIFSPNGEEIDEIEIPEVLIERPFVDETSDENPTASRTK